MKRGARPSWSERWARMQADSAPTDPAAAATARTDPAPMSTVLMSTEPMGAVFSAETAAAGEVSPEGRPLQRERMRRWCGALALPAGAPRLAEGWIVDEVLDPEVALAAVPPLRARPAPGAIYFDLETTGFGATARVFLVGMLFEDGRGLRLVQHVAGDGGGERQVLLALLEAVIERPTLVTFNGRSYDVPLVRRRLRFHELPELPPTLEVVDLLHPARRRHRHELPDCRLATLERSVIGVQRPQHDMPGREAPLRYRDFLASGLRTTLDPVLAHNRTDLTSLVVLHESLLDK